MKQRPWDKHEATILLEAVIRVHSGEIDRNKAIIEVSDLLRKTAQMAGVEIDDVYRNVAGITFQMYSMESAYFGKTIIKPATSIFTEIVQLRKNNRKEYNVLLEETRKMIAICNRSWYQEWLISTGMKYEAARNYGNWLNNIDEYAINNGYSEKSVYDYKDVNELVELYDILIKSDDYVKNHRDYYTSFRKFITYRSEGSIQLGRGCRTSGGDTNPKRYEYQEWLVESGMKDTAARNYGNWLGNLSEYAIQGGYVNISLYEYENPSELIEIYELLCEDETLVSEHRDYLTSLKKYISYRSNGDIELGRRQRVSKIVSGNDSASSSVELSEEEKKCFSEILEEYFEEGLVINAIRLDKFRMIYEKKYGIELSSDDEYLTEQLKVVGNLIDGRIYPKHGEKQNNLISEIRGEICDALNKGASCVYISSVMQRWQQTLAEQLNIYNETALKELIMAEDMPGVYSTNVVFKLTQAKVYPDKDVIDFMKNSHSPVEYDTLQKHLWYMPLDVIKHVLVTTQSLAQVDVETYMYAPNFPASASELQQLIKFMQARINVKGFLVSKDIAEIINEKCPTIAINTKGYKDWAYRNVFRYILKDNFEFGGSVVSEKGKKLEMWQVYRGFCHDYEHLSFDELKQFSNEVGVQIYWDDVLTEMVRINSKELVRRDLIHFDVDATDRVLDGICDGDYLPIKQIGLFLHFPVVEYPWNGFLLESYLKCSKRFKLFHVCYSENGVYGIVVRKNSSFTDYRDVVIDMLARSNEWSNMNNALALIVEKGYQARRRWTGFDKVVQEALLRREHIITERK
ncbi:hypothetical protein SAMN04487934_11449 [Eubacterium ruminantium]|nr:hypothetical protein SAMN04487934_11449 [Eubacterium ruminantium]